MRTPVSIQRSIRGRVTSPWVLFARGLSLALAVLVLLVSVQSLSVSKLRLGWSPLGVPVVEKRVPLRHQVSNPVQVSPVVAEKDAPQIAVWPGLSFEEAWLGEVKTVFLAMDARDPGGPPSPSLVLPLRI